VTRGFEWLVAWRYLRTAPRGGRVGATLALFPSLLGAYCLVRVGLDARAGASQQYFFGRPLGEVWVELIGVMLVALGLGLGLVAIPVWRRHGRGAASWVIRFLPLVFVAIGAALVWMGLPGRRIDLGPDVVLVDWQTYFKLVGLASLIFASWVAVFTAFKRRQTIFTTVSTFGVFLGTWALIVALSVMNGFEADLRQKILGSNAHVRISREEGAFDDWRKTLELARQIDGVVGASPYVASEVVLAPRSGYNYNGVIIRGIDPHTINEVSELEKNLQKDGRLDRLWPIAPDGTPMPYEVGSDAGPIGPGVDPYEDYVPQVFDGDEGGEPGAGDPNEDYQPELFDEPEPDDRHGGLDPRPLPLDLPAPRPAPAASSPSRPSSSTWTWASPSRPSSIPWRPRAGPWIPWSPRSPTWTA
jgi:hypothetical protein